MTQPLTQLDTQFITQLIHDRAPVTLFLLNGVKLQGIIVEEGEGTLVLERENLRQLVYKHALIHHHARQSALRRLPKAEHPQ